MAEKAEFGDLPQTTQSEVTYGLKAQADLIKFWKKQGFSEQEAKKLAQEQAQEIFSESPRK